MQRVMKIGEASRLLGVSDETIRNWERRGLLKAGRLLGGHRVFTMSDLEKIQERMMKMGRQNDQK